MLRITGGRLKGRLIKAPRGGAGVRASEALVRRAIFDVLGEVAGFSVLDLFGGSGSLAIEALSRGAAKAVIVEKDRKIAQTARENLLLLGLAERGKVLVSPVARALPQLKGERFDLIFLDPPYGKGEINAALRGIYSNQLAAEGAVIVIEHQGEEIADFTGGRLMKRKKYGGTEVAFLLPAPENSCQAAEKRQFISG